MAVDCVFTKSTEIRHRAASGNSWSILYEAKIVAGPIYDPTGIIMRC